MSHAMNFLGEGPCRPDRGFYFRRSTEWVPVEDVGIGRSFTEPSGVIYHRTTGLVPHYTGHVPGYRFNIGRSYGPMTTAAKHWLQMHRG